MKTLFLIAVIGVAIWIWQQPPSKKVEKAKAAPQIDMAAREAEIAARQRVVDSLAAEAAAARAREKEQWNNASTVLTRPNSEAYDNWKTSP